MGVGTGRELPALDDHDFEEAKAFESLRVEDLMASN